MTQADMFYERGAVFSECRKYRYELWRRWGDGPYCQFICLNPSTADETNDDPTVRRCINYARDWGYDAFVMTNLFAFRATDPEDMKAAEEPEGDMTNLNTIGRLAVDAGVVVAAWGVHGTFNGRDKVVRAYLEWADVVLKHLDLSKDGHPRHPLYLKKNLKPQILR